MKGRSKDMKPSRFNLVINESDGTLLFNTLSQALLWIDRKNTNKVLKTLEDPSSAELSKAEVEKLKRGMFLLDDNFDELEFLKFRFNTYRYSDRFLRYTIVLTHSCNFDCVYCYQKVIHISSGSYISEKVQSNFLLDVERKLEYQKPNLLSVTFYGGEPLLLEETVVNLSSKLKRLCEKYGVKYDSFIVTNGYLLTEKMVDDLQKAGIKALDITLDGTEVYHDRYRKARNGAPTFSSIFENIFRAVNKGLFVQIRVNVSRENIEDVKKLIDRIAEKKLRVEFNFQPIEIVEGNPTGFQDTALNTEEFAEIETKLWWYIREKIPEYPFEYFKKPRFARCDAMCKNSFVVDVDGRVYKCWGELGMENCSGFLKETGVEFTGSYLKWLTYDPLEDEECRRCLVLPFCMGGCAFNRVVYRTLKSSKVKKPHTCIPLRYNLNEFIKIVADYKRRSAVHGISQRSSGG